MPNTENTILVDEFSQTFHELAQQMVPRMRPYIGRVEMMGGDSFLLDRIGPVEARESTSRFAKVTNDDVNLSRREIPRKRYTATLYLDSSDVRGSLLARPADYAKQCVQAMNRQMDRVIAQAAFADVRVASNGKNVDTTLSFADDGGITIDATAALDKSIMQEIQQNFINSEVGIDMDDPMWLTITGAENTSLINETQFSSSDFTVKNQNVNDRGMIQHANGFNLIHFGANAPSPILGLNADGSERFLVACTKMGIALGISQDVRIKIVERDDLVETTQVEAIMEIGAVRTEGVRVQKVIVTA